MELQRLCVKFFTDENTSVTMHEFIPVFHAWIQNHTLADHLLIDVADYRHVHQGPGIVLVAHEANFSLDQAENRLGLLYQRKQPLPGNPEQRLLSLLSYTLNACQKLEHDPALKGRICFKGNEFLLICNDRLLAPNTEGTFEVLTTTLKRVLSAVPGYQEFTLTRKGEPKERLKIFVQTSGKRDVASFLNALQSRLLVKT